MSNISYLRVSTAEQTVENQRQAISNAGWAIDKEFTDSAVSGTTVAESRPGWAACTGYLREGDTLVVYALDRMAEAQSMYCKLLTTSVRVVYALS